MTSTLSPAIVALWKQLRQLQADPAADRWEIETPPGRKSEYYDLCIAIDQAFGREPWRQSIIETAGEEMPSQSTVDRGDYWVADWRQALGERTQLDAAISWPN
jgi:hypothetical protein